MAENGQGCSKRARMRGLCTHHYNALRSKPELLKQIALPPRVPKRYKFEKRTDAGEHPLECVVIENGVPCTRSPEHCGVCGYHRRLIGNHERYSLHDFYLPRPLPVLKRKKPEETADGLCWIIEDGRPCAEPPYRG